MIRILLIDDHTLFRSGVKALLQRQPDFEVCRRSQRWPGGRETRRAG